MSVVDSAIYVQDLSQLKGIYPSNLDRTGKIGWWGAMAERGGSLEFGFSDEVCSYGIMAMRGT
jgi:hypothetical protein